MPAPFPIESAGEDPTATCLAFPESALVPPVVRYRPGSVLAEKYRLEALLGEGGMGAVWRASNLLLELPVAIKLIRADLDRDALRGRLQLEARSVAKVGHPAIVRIYDVSETEQGDPFIVMELLHGETLAQLLTRGRLAATRAVQLLLPLIDACASAHARGIVHRDLKPDNLLIAEEEQSIQPKILDFGIAKLTDPRDANHRLTEIGTVVGSPDYMSPEQARGRDDVDYRTDIWSMCVVLYEAVTGHPPFAAGNYNALLRAIVEDEPRSLLEEAAGDPELWQIIQKGLSKERTMRQRSMAELGRVLAAWLIKNGVHEDACGTSLEAKWLGRSSDPQLEHNDTLQAAVVPQAAAAHASAAGIDSRGPFTATIRRKSAARARSLRGLLAFAAIFATLGLATTLALSKTTPMGIRATAEPNRVAAHTTSPARAPLPATLRDDAAHAHAAAAAPLALASEPAPDTGASARRVPLELVPRAGSVSQVSSAAIHANAHPTAASHVAHRTVAPPTTTASAPAAAIKAAPRPLDLIAPY